MTSLVCFNLQFLPFLFNKLISNSVFRRSFEAEMIEGEFGHLVQVCNIEGLVPGKEAAIC